MDDALRVSGIQCIGNLDAQIEHCLDLQRLAPDPASERLPFQQFHGDEGSPLDLVNLIDCADVLVVQGGRSFGLPLKAAEGLRVVREVVGKKLQGNVAAKLDIFRLIHHSHSAAANFVEDPVMGNSLPNGLGGSRHRVAMLGGGEGQVNESDRVGCGSKEWLANRSLLHSRSPPIYLPDLLRLSTIKVSPTSLGEFRDNS